MDVEKQDMLIFNKFISLKTKCTQYKCLMMLKNTIVKNNNLI